ncbi:MAG: 2,4-dihydroxyhept-2-ene-1,7-dioic acid aldolase [Nitrospina sp.]|jgi:2-dehydro-3-deoxyglucarate aldolase|nr:2,4-dihydroxyhept-2-ene-1,7-dioic acid aldolase [Nitrospina sp.]MBT4556789.1 2,4-dihydroxyhept-2-ene-1,7-dioic acid aldolase [Nitrospina sp.]MBT6901255.1 2,4-dihydroxyhept-2-ene-1,7-dioic acid aldolase [Nitrospina sp.]MBT7198304.1 2,4-dihydroxyhept-2-ene-1,7-dioic acid aldolase [Nitrospina sp.]MBT7708905.1 2,4-dihydroxyhept-2-ene-1,7-dioic acid aldolase [Nitrospina sp.]
MQLKSKLENNILTVGSWITLAHPAIAEIMSRRGFDWVTVDLEHSVINIREAEELIRVIDLCGNTPLVRLSSNDPVQIKRVMDAGSAGVILPMVRSLEDIDKAFSAIHYPSAGARGVGLARAQGYGVRFQEYKGWLEKNAVLIAQIENIDAVNNIESILSSDKVDGYLIGPYDLSASMGVPGDLDHPDVITAIKKIKHAGLSTKKPGGLHVVEPDPQKLDSLINDGFLFLAYSVDIRMLDISCLEGIKVRDKKIGQ